MFVDLRQFYKVAQVGLEVEILLPQLPECCWDYEIVAQ